MACAEEPLSFTSCRSNHHLRLTIQRPTSTRAWIVLKLVLFSVLPRHLPELALMDPINARMVCGTSIENLTYEKFTMGVNSLALQHRYFSLTTVSLSTSLESWLRFWLSGTYFERKPVLGVFCDVSLQIRHFSGPSYSVQSGHAIIIRTHPGINTRASQTSSIPRGLQTGNQRLKVDARR